MRLLIFKVNQLGDNIVFLPVVQMLARVLPEWELIVATSPVAAPLYGHCAPGVEAVQHETAEFNGAWRSVRSMWRLIRWVHDLKPDACLVANDQGNVAHFLAWCSGARIRIGPLNEKLPCTRLLSHRVPLDLSALIARQNWQLLLALLDALRMDRVGIPREPPAPDLSALSTSDMNSGPFVLIHPGASREYKRWFIERYVDLANRLSKRVEVRYVLQGEDVERLLDEQVHRVPAQHLEDFAALMKGAALFIGNNSGPMHLASCYGIPSIIFGGPSPRMWLPAWNVERFTMLGDPSLGCQPCDRLDGPANVCTNRDEPMACMKRFSVDTVEHLALGRLGLG